MKHFARSIITSLMVISGAILGGTGCVKVDATVNLDRDGGGTLRVIYGMPTYIIKQAEFARDLSHSLDVAAGKSNLPPYVLDVPYIYDEAVLKTKFTAMAKDGVVLDSIKTREQGGWNYVDFSIRFNNFAMLVKQSIFKDIGVGMNRLDGKFCQLKLTLPPLGNTPDVAGVVTQESLNKLTPFFNGFRVVVRLGLPGEIRNSNSLMSDSRRATWEWDFDKDHQALGRLARDKVVIVFDGSDVRIKDFEKSIGTISIDEK